MSVGRYPTVPRALHHDSLTFVSRYRERLWPAAWVWGAGPALVGVLSVAYGAAYGALWGWLIFLPVSALTLVGIVLVSPTVNVDAESLQVGRAVIPLRALGQCMTLEGPEFTRETRRGDPTVFLALRTWATHTAILVEVVDERDPHSAWLISTRHPHQLKEVISGAKNSPDASTG